MLLVASAVLGIGLRVTNGAFPEQQVDSCTFQSRASDSGRHSALLPSAETDCGSFHADSMVPCTSDPDREVLLAPGTTYDLIVRGPRIPMIAAPQIVSAVVSVEQRDEAGDPLEGVDLEGHEKLQQLQEEWSPESLRAFDDEQPPFGPSCDALRSVMTSKGIQSVRPARAEQYLTVPDGVTARDPLLPCEGYQCEVHG